jgi:hypothetical protein
VWYQDLSVFAEHPTKEMRGLLAVGWLQPDKSFSTGPASKEFFTKLCQLTQNDIWVPWASGGVHFCEFCRFTGGNGAFHYTGGSGVFEFEGYSVAGCCTSEIYIPGDNAIYMSPMSILHYMDCHGYCPPEEYVNAVMQCPPMRSIEYFKAMFRSGSVALFPDCLNSDGSEIE